jgi:hypothetical protein
MADLTIVVDVRDNQTMSSYRIPKSDKLIFKNASTTDELVITLKGNGDSHPICENNQPIQASLTVAAGASKTVRICDDFDGREFLYTARIGQAEPEDPIVIIEKKMYFVFDPASFAFGAVIAAAVTYFVLKSLARKVRPQQG